jgi:serine phosphatase RsbU (regulator of sigma subunit)
MNELNKNKYSQNNVKILRQEIESLKVQLMTTSLISELTKVMHGANSTENVVKTILLGIHEIAGFDRIILFELNKVDFSLTPKYWYGIPRVPLPDLQIPLGFEGGEITDAIFLNRHLIVSEPSPTDDLFCKELQSDNYLVVPLVGRVIPSLKDIGQEPPANPANTSNKAKTQNLSENDRRRMVISSADFKTQGVFWMDRNSPASPITGDDIATLLLILNQAGIMIENIRMHRALEAANTILLSTNNQLNKVNKDLREAQAKINRDLENARTIQQGLLPEALPYTPHLSVGAAYIPADAVGGDYYDAFEIAPGIFGIIVADVSGHGVASALIMSMVKVLIKTFANKTDGPQKTLEKANYIFNTEIKMTNFVTVFYAVINTTTNTICYTSAGHCPAILVNRKEKSYSIIKSDGLFLGVFKDMMLKEACLTYTPDTLRIVLYTDGLTEAKNNADIMFEMDRLIAVTMATIETPAQKTCSKILARQKEFCGKNATYDDDITILVVDF